MQGFKIKIQEVFAWAGIALVTLAALLGTYYFHVTGPLLAVLWLIWLMFALGFAYFTEKGKQVYYFAKEAKAELEKVVWPTRQETTQTTLIVMVMVTVTGFVLWGIDSGMMWAIGKITQLG